MGWGGVELTLVLCAGLCTKRPLTVLDTAAVKDTLLFLSDQLLADCLKTKLHREKERETDRQTDRQTGRQAHRHRERQTERDLRQYFEITKKNF